MVVRVYSMASPTSVVEAKMVEVAGTRKESASTPIPKRNALRPEKHLGLSLNHAFRMVSRV